MNEANMDGTFKPTTGLGLLQYSEHRFSFSWFCQCFLYVIFFLGEEMKVVVIEIINTIVFQLFNDLIKF